MSNFNNGGLGDGGLQRAKDAQYSKVTEETITNFLKDLIYTSSPNKEIESREEYKPAMEKQAKRYK